MNPAGLAGPAALHVPGGEDADGPARFAGLLDPGFLAGAGWDAARAVLSPPPEHPLLGRVVCRAPGCLADARTPSLVCTACARRLAVCGQAEDDAGSLPAEPWWASAPACMVAGCRRSRPLWRQPLCQAHLDQRHQVIRLPLGQFLACPKVQPLPACGPCTVPACTREQTAREGSPASFAYCRAHYARWREALRSGPQLDEMRWRAAQPAVARPGEVSFRGLPPLVTAQLLYGLQQRTRAGAKTDEGRLRAFCDALRQQQVTTIGDFAGGPADPAARAIAGSVTGHVRRAFADPETEKAKDVWDLAVFGHGGTLPFTRISQLWLREAAKAWVADDLPRRRGRTVASTAQHFAATMTLLSQSLRMRPDRGELPAALARPDIEAFLHRLAYQESAAQISRDARMRTCHEAAKMLRGFRALGLTRPGAAAAGLGEDFTLRTSDVPARPDPGEPGKDLPQEIMRQLCDHLPSLPGPEIRVAVELLIDTGRRPTEICRLAFDCLARDASGAPVLVYDNHKASRLGRRLPVSDATARLITSQQQRVRGRFPDTPAGELKLLPSPVRNPGGRKAITYASLVERHREWIAALPGLRTGDGGEFAKAKIIPYAYRHTYAQRHADTGVAPDVLRELMSHRTLNATRGYYRIGEARRREAVDRVTALSFDRHGNRIWRDARALLDAEHARYALGEVAVPYGACTEPSNVQAGGRACPVRFRCAGCDHFRTDVSYLPDLTVYLDDLLRTRERLAAAVPGVDEWARREATPSQEEITRIRRLIARVKDDITGLGEAERAQIDEAVTVLRRSRGVMLGMPAARPAAHATDQEVPA